MIAWTQEQEAVLATRSRVTLVRAGPGSGKTKVFVELLKRHVDSWRDRRGGVAALSFTNVAQEEIATRLGGRLAAPHFVGTLDSFFLRFVVGPFGHLAGVTSSGARLIPSPLDEELREPSFQDPTHRKPSRIRVFRVGLAGGTENSPDLSFRPYHGGRDRSLSGEAALEALKKKKNEWAVRGRITHSDSHYLAASIVRGPHGEAVRKLLARRFPIMLVDELQDTGHFLGRALLALLAEVSVGAVLVGDEDQRIFGFSGVDPQLFSHVADVEGCKVYPLRITQRCARRISAVASALSRSGARVEPKDGAKDGAAVLFVHDDPKVSRAARSLQRAGDLCRAHGCESLAVLVRKRDEKRALLGTDAEDDCPLQARGPRALHKAVIRLMEGRGDQASQLVESQLGHLCLAKDVPRREDLADAGIDATEFRRRARRLVLEAAQAAQSPAGETWGQWNERMKESLRRAASDVGGTEFARRLGGMFKSVAGDKPECPRVRRNATPGSWRDGIHVEVATIHEAKGREFDAVLLYCSQPSRGRGVTTCPAESWWSKALDSEEREVAFVAVTRAKNLLIVAVHAETFTALQGKRPEFTALFHPVEILDRD